MRFSPEVEGALGSRAFSAQSQWQFLAVAPPAKSAIQLCFFRPGPQKRYLTVFFRPKLQKGVIYCAISAQNQKWASVWQNNRLENDLPSLLRSLIEKLSNNIIKIVA